MDWWRFLTDFLLTTVAALLAVSVRVLTRIASDVRDIRLRMVKLEQWREDHELQDRHEHSRLDKVLEDLGGRLRGVEIRQRGN